jgi:tRNA G46 methylase TrmB
LRVAKPLKRIPTKTDIKESGLINGGQTAVHENLEVSVQRHIDHLWRQPLHRPTIDVYRQLVALAPFADGSPFMLDSGCGTGSSTQALAADHPGQLVIGVDQSSARLARSGVSTSIHQSGNCVLVRAELATFWRLLLKDGLKPVRHFLLYPNPWPKPGHLARRWHGHPVFPDLLSVGGDIELRCNWDIYALEFAQAVQLATGAPLKVQRIRPKTAISPFEKKYMDRGHALYAVTVPGSVSAGFRRSRPAK